MNAWVKIINLKNLNLISKLFESRRGVWEGGGRGTGVGAIIMLEASLCVFEFSIRDSRFRDPCIRDQHLARPNEWHQFVWVKRLLRQFAKLNKFANIVNYFQFFEGFKGQLMQLNLVTITTLRKSLKVKKLTYVINLKYFLMYFHACINRLLKC